MKSNDINYTESYKGDYMSYRLPSDDEIVKLIINYDLDTNPFTTNTVLEGLNKLIRDIETAIKIANLNPKNNNEYIYYLRYFRRYIHVSYNKDNSSLRVKLVDYYKLKELHKLL